MMCYKTSGEKCEYCWEPRKLAVLWCEKADKPICGAEYLANDIPAPEWCTKREAGDE